MQQKQFLERLAMLAKLCNNTVLTPELLALYDKGLRRFGYPRLCEALESHIIHRSGRDAFPSIGDIARMIVPQETDEDRAIEAAGRIVTAIDRHGWNNMKEAKEFIGEVGWYVVERSGGWQSLCEGMATRNLPTMRAQFREMALSAIRRARAGTLNAAPTFEKLPGERNGALTGIAETVKTITGGTHGTKT